MHQIDSADAVGSPPTPLAPGTPGHFGNGTTVRADWLNAVQGELLAFLVLLGGTADKTVNNQISLLVAKHLLGLTAAASGSFSTAPSYDRALLVATGVVFGTKSAAIAATNASVAGASSAVVGGTDNAATNTNTAVAGGEGNEAAGERSFVGGGETNTASGASSAVVGGVGNVCTVAGAGSAIAGGTLNSVEALYAGALGGHTNEVLGDKSVALGGGNNTVDGESCAALASDACDVTTTTNAVAIASANGSVLCDHAALLATANCSIENGAGVQAIIGSASCKIESAEENVILASLHCASDTDTIPPEGSVYGGWDLAVDVEPSWRIESDGGHIRGKGTVASGGLDYAEYFPNADGVAHEPGLIMARSGHGARRAQPKDRVLGVVSATPTIIGGDDSLSWSRKWLRDDWGRLLKVAVEVEREVKDRDAMREWRRARQALKTALAKLESDAKPEVRKDLENQLAALPRPPKKVVKKAGLANVKNPDYRRPEAGHKPRSERPGEHTVVGLLGQLLVRVDASVTADDDVIAGVDGIGTRGFWVGRGAQIECMKITSPFDGSRGYAIALCLVR